MQTNFTYITADGRESVDETQTYRCSFDLHWRLMKSLPARRMSIIDGRLEAENKFSDGLVQTVMSYMYSTDSGVNIKLV